MQKKLLVDENWVVKISDFGMASSKENLRKSLEIGTSFYMAPELLTGNGYDSKADVYSFAIVNDLNFFYITFQYFGLDFMGTCNWKKTIF